MPTSPSASAQLLLTSLQQVPNHIISIYLGAVLGKAVCSLKSPDADALAAAAAPSAATYQTYQALFQQAYQQAQQLLIQQAQALGANAVVGLRLTTSSLTQGAAELQFYGLAVVTTAQDSPRPAAAAWVPSAVAAPAAGNFLPAASLHSP